jgi:hypothetical protein
MAIIRKMTDTPFEFVRKKITRNLLLNFDCFTPVKAGTQVWSLKKDMDSCPGFAEASFRGNDELIKEAPRWASESETPFVNGRPQRAAPTAFEHLFFMD